MHILWLLLTSSITIYASPLDSITYGPGYTLKRPKIWKNLFFDTPFFYERMVMYGHMMLILIAPDEMCNISLFYAISLNLGTFLVQKKTRFLTTLKYHFFPNNVGWFWYILVALVEFYKNHTLCHMFSHIPTMWHRTPPRTARLSD